MRRIALALTAASAFAVPAIAHAQNPLSSIFNCNNPNSRQGQSAVIGGLIGGVLGNTLAGDDDETLGTVLGAAVGAGIGSYVGCNMTPQDGQRAEDATLRALSQNRSTTWNNARMGTSGRIDVVNSFYRNNVSARVPDPYYNATPTYRSLDEVRFARGVSFPANYSMANAVYRADARVNVRATPNSRGAILTTLTPSERIEAVARVNNDWLLVARQGIAIGYVAEWVVDLERPGYANNDPYGYNSGYGYNNGYQQVTERQLCRTFDQTVQQSGYRPTTQRFTACQSSNGEWLIQS